MVTQFSEIDALSPSDFETFVMELLLQLGWKDAYITKIGDEYKHGDGGIDIFAYRNDLKFGVEVKQRSRENAVDVKALNQLVTGGKLSNTRNLILVTNSYFTSEVITRALRLGVELIDRDLLHSMYIEKRTEIGRAAIKPRKYQLDVIQQCLASFRENKTKLLIEMATGLGKTYTSALLLKEMIRLKSAKYRVLFLVHQVEIVIQSITAFKNVFGIGQFTFSTCFNGEYPEDSDFVFGTFDTFYIQLPNIEKNMFDVVIVDEAHHAPAHTYKKILKELTPKYLIGLTATPFREDGRSVYEVFGGEQGAICKYDLVWALKHNKLAFPKYLVLLNDLDHRRLSELKKGFQIKDIDNLLFLNRKDAEVIRIIDKTINDNKIEKPKAIVFCKSIAHIRHLITFFEPGSATFVHSKMDPQQRRKNIVDFREGLSKYILVCDLFNEGIDIPETNILVFLRFTGSKRIWLQQLGRGLRKSSNKEFVFVLDFVGSIERINDIKNLQKEIQDASIDFDDFEPRIPGSEIFQDDSMEVHFNMHAAQVLALLEENSYRLTTRSRAINSLRQHYEETGSLPEMQSLSNFLTDISLDQVGTLFGSFVCFVRTSIPEADLFSSKDHVRVAGFIADFTAENNLIPLVDTVVAYSRISGLVFATTDEIKTLFPVLVSTVPVDPRTQEVGASSNVEITDDQASLFAIHSDSVFVTKDLLSLSSRDRMEIKNLFGSEFRFVKLLNSYRSGSLESK